jgi:hypothetical protein
MSLELLLTRAKELKLFDFDWYRSQHKKLFKNELLAFKHYIRTSPFSPVSPSANFDTITYFENYPDVYAASMSPLEHYLIYGQIELRHSFPIRHLWVPSDEIPDPPRGSPINLKIAVVLHIFYPDMIDDIYEAIHDFPTSFDLYIAGVSDEVYLRARNVFPGIKNLKKFVCKKVPNRGRNFGPLLVEFSKNILSYDLFCHIHSKKSLYSGKQQTQWFKYLIEYLIRDKEILRKTLGHFNSDKALGIFFPTTFWNLPIWATHWLKNRGLGRQVLREAYSIEDTESFFPYPVGGMFWARPESLRDLLEKNWIYDDFPPEPLPDDGTILHVIERILPKIAEKNQFRQFYYYPPTGTYTSDKSYVYEGYRFGHYRLKQAISSSAILSFDIFDTLVFRKYYEPDFAKYLLPSVAHINISGQDFVELRNGVELELRRASHFKNDIDIYQIYSELTRRLPGKHDSKRLGDLEFELDLQTMHPKVSILNLIALASQSKPIKFVTDTYYTRDQILKLIRKVGVRCDFELFVSSDLRLRKDTGELWSLLKDKFRATYAPGNFLHIGDNVCSDSQIPGDHGIRTFHILSPLEKWAALGFPREAIDVFEKKKFSEVRKWGRLVSYVGQHPFLDY